MKVNPKKAALIGLAASTLFGTSSCGASNNEEPTVYGPPQSFSTASPSEQEIIEVTEDQNLTPVVYGPPTVEDNENEDVYGPPEDN